MLPTRGIITETPNLAELIRDLPAGNYISEWKHIKGGEAHYAYHSHRQDRGHQLKQAFNAGKKGGNPELTDVYARAELDGIIAPAPADSAY